MMTLSNRTKRYLSTGLADSRAADEIVEALNLANVATTGITYFVDSVTGSDAAGANNGRSGTVPYATLDHAINQCRANKGDVILLMPGHAETIIADSGVDIDVAGITIIGLGQGAARPTFTFETAVTADFKLAAASTTVINVLFLGNIDALTGVIEVSAADCALIDCEYRDVTGQATDVIVTTANADRLLIDGHKHYGAAGDGGDTAVVVVGCDDVTIRNSKFYGNFDLGAIECRTTAAVRLRVHDCEIWTEGAEDLAILDTITGSTGLIGPNVLMALQDNAANITEAITGATFMVFDVGVHVVNLANEKSIAINWTASTDA
jgi:hypothetical protein